MQPNGVLVDVYSEGGMTMAQKLYAGLSFEQAVQKYAKNVYTACMMRLDNAADADDCVQNTFIKLYQNAPDFHDENHLKAWLLRVAINECRKTARHRRRFVALDTLREHPLSQSDAERDMTWALMRLEPKYREALYLYYYERYKVDEIAEILDTKSNTVKSLLKRGREKLKTIYGGDDE